MQLKLRRSQRESGLISKNVIFCLDARVEFSPEERANIQRYKLQGEVLYNSEAQLNLLAKAEAHRAQDTIGSNLKSLAVAAFAATKLWVTVQSLERGQHIECKSLDELLGAEEAIQTACQNLKGYLEVAATFDGREVVVDYSDAAQPLIVAEAAPAQALVAAAIPVAAAPAPALVASLPKPSLVEALIPEPQPMAPSIADTPMIAEYATAGEYDPAQYPPVYPPMENPLDGLRRWWSGLKPEHQIFSTVAAVIVFIFLFIV